jgi:hypothetical protein
MLHKAMQAIYTPMPKITPSYLSRGTVWLDSASAFFDANLLREPRIGYLAQTSTWMHGHVDMGSRRKGFSITLSDIYNAIS